MDLPFFLCRLGNVRYLVGPVELALTSKVASAQSPRTVGHWVVTFSSRRVPPPA